MVGGKGCGAGAEIAYASFDCNLFFDTEQDVSAGIADPCSVIADAMKDEWVKIVFLYCAKGCSSGLALWEGYCCVEVDVGGVGAGDDVAF
jgi:hypothetical protein